MSKDLRTHFVQSKRSRITLCRVSVNHRIVRTFMRDVDCKKCLLFYRLGNTLPRAITNPRYAHRFKATSPEILMDMGFTRESAEEHIAEVESKCYARLENSGLKPINNYFG